MESLGHASPETKKLMLTLQDKEKYVMHLRNLQFYLRIKKVHRVLEFEQECWMRPYIELNTNFRKKAKNNFEKDFYKLMNNLVFRKRTDIKLVRPDEQAKIAKPVASPLFAGQTEFTNDLKGIKMHKSRLLLNKPVYTGMTILENSKILMYDFYYNFLKKEYGDRCELLFQSFGRVRSETRSRACNADRSLF